MGREQPYLETQGMCHLSDYLSLVELGEKVLHRDVLKPGLPGAPPPHSHRSGPPGSALQGIPLPHLTLLSGLEEGRKENL